MDNKIIITIGTTVAFILGMGTLSEKMPLFGIFGLVFVTQITIYLVSKKIKNIEEGNIAKPTFLKSLLVMIVSLGAVFATTASLNKYNSLNSQNSSVSPATIEKILREARIEKILTEEKMMKLKEKQLKVDTINFRCSILINNIYELDIRTKQYMLDTKDMEPSIEKINKHFNITKKWINYHDESLNLDVSFPDGIVITNIFSTEQIDGLTREIFKNHPLIDSTTIISEDFSKIKIPYDAKMLEFIKKHTKKEGESK